MGNNCQSGTKGKKPPKNADNFFDREKWREQKRDDEIKKNLNPVKKRTGAGAKDQLVQPAAMASMPPPPPPGPSLTSPSPNARSFEEETLNLMRYQLRHDANAFLLNNILLSVQFFENYERNIQNIKNNPISEREHLVNEAMVHHNKHVFFADRLQELVNDYVGYQRERGGQVESLSTPRLYVIYDNVEASEPGDTSDYSAVLDAPFYKLQIEECKESGYVKLKKLEVLESTLPRENEPVDVKKIDNSDDSIYTDSERESNASDDSIYSSKGEESRVKLAGSAKHVRPKTNFVKANNSAYQKNERRSSGPTKQVSLQVSKSNISKLKELKKSAVVITEDTREYTNDNIDVSDMGKPRKSILKNPRRLSGPTKNVQYSQNQSVAYGSTAIDSTIDEDTEINDNKPNISRQNEKNKIKLSGPAKNVKYSQDVYVELRSASLNSSNAKDTETSGYRSNSSRQNETSGYESEYGYSTITEATTPKKIQLSSKSTSVTSGVLHDKTWAAVHTRVTDWSDDEDDLNDAASQLSTSRNLYETNYYLSSIGFMNDFVDNFILNIGSVLGISQESINTAVSQGASIYCDSTKTSSKYNIEVFPALLAAWPSTANQWIIRERKIIQNPRTNFSYQWPTKYMVNKAIGFGCFLLPVGYRPKRGLNTNQKLQWKVAFPAAERYLESCLAHAHMRCYLFALALHKTFIENRTSKIGVDSSHLKNHLFWQCEDNYAKWPEHRLGEALLLFLKSFYFHFGQRRFPNYFVESCNDFKSIPKPLLLRQQNSLANILEAPVMHILSALDKIRYTKKDFYPPLEVHELYKILTIKDPLRLINPNLPISISKNYDDNGTDSDRDTDDISIFEREKRKGDKNYQWKKEKHRLIERRKAEINNRKRMSMKQETVINSKIILPQRLDVERRRLVLEFFIKHFIAMAKSSDFFSAIRQATIYLEQAQRLCILLQEEPAGEMNAEEFLKVIRELLVDYQRKLVTEAGYKLPPRRESNADRVTKSIPKLRPKYENITSADSPVESSSFSAFTFVDVHAESSSKPDIIKLNDVDTDEEDSKL